MSQNNYICSPMNYIGGKYKILPQIMPLFPQKINNFVDLFCGGCNVGINVKAKNIIFNDNLNYLISLYQKFQNTETDNILNYIDKRISDLKLSLTNNDGYLTLRKQYNEHREPLDLFLLTAYSFNHQIRFNNKHEFNNPFGKERSFYNTRMKNNLINFLDNLHNKSVFFSCNNFDKFDFNFLSEDDFVYCDPPYLITTGTYNDGKRGFTGWNKEQEYKLLELLDFLDSKKVKFALSNVLTHKGKENTILKHWIEKNNYHVKHLEKDYSNSNYHTKNKKINATDEILVTNYTTTTIQYSLFSEQ
ncbi:MAG: Dam family site-specific DNA-(adenine-N6)-methyltransferase [Bacteroidales bacterium]|nr:Dam family site-specific DNA-(adenine-N6)-methyltransferase [Bacteroidales bacterium]